MSQITTFTTFKAQTQFAFWNDLIPIDKLMIEANFCPKCHKSLVYRGKAKVTEYRAYGICEPCNFAKLFWTEPADTASYKKKVCEVLQKETADTASISRT
jgi:hypothetical protein